MALRYLDQSGEVGGCWNNHRYSIGMQENSLRRQHALREGIPSAAQHIKGGLGENPYTQLLPNYKAESQIASVGSQRLITAEKGEKENPNQQLLMWKFSSQTSKRHTQQLQSWSYQNGRRYFWEQLAWHD